MKYGFKGFNLDLCCRGEKFEIGLTYTKSHNGIPKLCTGEGYHYCEKLQNVYPFYALGQNNRFCLIEILGPFSSDNSKSITTSFRILHDITDIMDNSYKMIDIIKTYTDQPVKVRDDNELIILNRLSEEGKYKAIKDKLRKEILEEDIKTKSNEEDVMAENLNIEIYKALQTICPLMHVGGSLGLFLHGVRLDRFLDRSGDLDVIMPYYIQLQDSGDVKFENIGGKASSNDFDETVLVINKGKSTVVDIKIDNKQKYEIISYKGFEYKVSKVETILEAKLRYGMNCQSKHIDDIHNMIGKKKETKAPEQILPF